MSIGQWVRGSEAYLAPLLKVIGLAIAAPHNNKNSKTLYFEISHMRIFLEVDSVTGLGHFQRMGRIAQELGRAGAEVTIGSGSMVNYSQFFSDMPFIKQPPFLLTRKVDDGDKYIVDGMPVSVPEDFSREQWVNDRIKAKLAAFDHVQPDIWIIEFWPFNRRVLDKEMDVLIPEAKRRGIKLVASVRELVPSGDATSTPESIAAANAKIIDYLRAFDLILAHADPNFERLEHGLPALAEFADKMFYTGYVAPEKKNRSSATQYQGVRPIVISSGSGESGEWLKTQMLKAHGCASPVLKERPWHFVLGPRYPKQAADAFKRQVAQLSGWFVECPSQLGVPAKPCASIVVQDQNPRLLDLFPEAAVTVSLIGYNTGMELLQSEANAIVAPLARLRNGDVWIDEEQRQRAVAWSARGWVVYADPKIFHNRPGDFARLMEQTLGRKPVSANVNMAGAHAAASLIMERFARPLVLPPRPAGQAVTVEGESLAA